MLVLMTIPLALWSTIASAEYLAMARAFLPGRPLGADLAALAPGRFVPQLLASPMFAPAALPFAAGLRLVAGLTLPAVAATGSAGPVAMLLAAVGVCTLWLAIVSGGSDGADKIALVACGAGGLIAAGMAVDDPLLCLSGLVWGAGQVTIAYATAGLAKLPLGFWRNGSAVAAVMTSYRAGHPFAAAIVRRPVLAIMLTWALILVEASFPIALFASQTVCFVALAAMAMFHLASALVMGLNTYPWAFTATYPCVIMANAVITGRGY
jgi:hypothetical protein